MADGRNDDILDIPSFAKRIKEKFPEYSETDDLDLVERIVRKNPVYASQVQLPPEFRLLKTSSGYAKIDELYEQTGRKYNVDPNLLLEQGRQETGFSPDVFYGRRGSSANAQGSGQFIPGTAKRFDVDVNDPVSGLEGQAKYMRELLDMFDGDEDLALAGYNAGEHRKSLKQGKIPPFKETQNYVKTIRGKLSEVRASYGDLRRLIGSQPTPTNPVQPAPIGAMIADSQIPQGVDSAPQVPMTDQRPSSPLAVGIPTYGGVQTLGGTTDTPESRVMANTVANQVQQVVGQQVAQQPQPVQVQPATAVPYEQWLQQYQVQDSPEMRAAYNDEIRGRGMQQKEQQAVDEYNAEVDVYNSTAQQGAGAQGQLKPEGPKGVSVVADWTGDDPRAGALDSAASKIANQIGVEYNIVRQTLEEGGFAEGDFTPEYAQRKKAGRETVQFGLDANKVSELQARQKLLDETRAKAKADFDTRVAAIDRSKFEHPADYEAEVAMQKAIADMNSGLLSYEEASRVYNDAKKVLDAWKTENPVGTPTKDTYISSGRFGEDMPAPTQIGKGRSLQQLQEDLEIRRKEAIDKYGSLSQWYESQQKFREKYRDKPNLALLDAMTSFVGEVGKAPIKGAGAISQSIAIASEAIDKALGVNDIPATERATYKFGEDLKNLAKEYGRPPGGWETAEQAGDVAGQVLTMIALTAATGGVGAGTLFATSLGASEQYEQATKKGVTGWDRLGAAGTGGLLAATDGLLLQGWFKTASLLQRSKMLTRMKDTIVEGLVKRGLVRSEADRLAAQMTDGFFDQMARGGGVKSVLAKAAQQTVSKGKEGLKEAGQESLLEAKGNDLFAYLTYDQTPERRARLTSYTSENLTEGVMGFFGGIVGASVGEISAKARQLNADDIQRARAAMEELKAQLPPETIRQVNTVLSKRLETLKPIEPKASKISTTLEDFDAEFLGMDGPKGFEATPAEEAPLRRVSDLGFYSQVEKTIEEKMPNAASADQIKGILKDTKQEERDWLGIDEFLADNPKPTKQELLDFVRSNQVELKEVAKGGTSGVSGGKLESFRTVGRQFAIPSETFEALRYYAENGYDFEYGLDASTEGDRNDQNAFLNAIAASPSGRAELRRQYEEYAQAYQRTGKDDARGDRTKYQDYSLPGGANYRELLLTLPSKGITTDQIAQKMFGKGFYALNDAQRQEVGAEYSKPTYKSSHWSEPNVLAHIRFDERTDAQGRKTLHVAEIQSDWHQQGRKKGYQVPSRPLTPAGEVALARVNELQAVNKAMLDDRSKVDPALFDRNAQEINALIEEHRLEPWHSGYQKHKVPDAPFKKSWHELAFKRVLRYAVENGFDAVSWDTGQTNARRYDLSQAVDSISYAKRGSDGAVAVTIQPTQGDEIRLWADPDGTIRDTDGDESWTGKKLDEVIGKELSEKIVTTATDSRQTLDGGDLEVGGEGMVGFYDKMLPAFANKYVKKWGSKVEASQVKTKPATSKLKDGYLQEGIHSVQITPAMRESVSAGQPLFRARTPESTEEHLDMQNLPTVGSVMQKGLSATYVEGKGLEVTPSTMEFLRRIEQAFSKRDVPVADGAFYSPAVARETASRINQFLERYQSAFSPKVQRELRILARVFEKLARQGVVVFVFDDVVLHEQLHGLSYMAAGGLRLTERIGDLIGFAQANQALIQKAFDEHYELYGYELPSLDQGVYSPRDMAKIAELVEEIAVSSLAKEYDRLGLTANEAATYLQGWLTAYKETNGVRSLRMFEKFFEGLQQSDNELGLVREAIENDQSEEQEATENESDERPIPAPTEGLDVAPSEAERTGRTGSIPTQSESATAGADREAGRGTEEGTQRERATIASAERAGIKISEATPRLYTVKHKNDQIRAAQEKIERIGLAAAINEAMLPATEGQRMEHTAFQMEVVQLLNNQAREAEAAGNKAMATAKLDAAQTVVSAIADSGTDYGQAISQLSMWQKDNPDTVTGYVQKRRAQNQYNVPLETKQADALREKAQEVADLQAQVDELRKKLDAKGSTPAPRKRADKNPEIERLEKRKAEIIARLTENPLRSVSTETPAFKKWFGDSKVVDADGKPLRAFHGTTGDFDAFDTNRENPAARRNRAWGGDLGSWFAAPSLRPANYDEGNAEYVAESFTERWNEEKVRTEYQDGANVLPVYLSIQNPMEFDGFEDFQDARGRLTAQEYKTRLIKQGYDGIVIRNSETDGNVDRDDWVAFNPNQIKSAIGNRGTFDPNEDSILRSVALKRPTKTYGKPKEGGVDVDSYHFSRESRPSLDTTLYGTGLSKSAGAEAARLKKADPRLSQRMYFYIDRGQGIRAESGVGNFAHAVRLRGMYDLAKDPLKLVEKAKGDRNAFEVSILDSGFPGYVNREMGMGVLLGEHKVEVEELGQQRPGKLDVEPGPLLNIGLDIPGGGKLKQADVIAAVEAAGGEVVKKSAHQSDTEETMVIELAKPLSAKQADGLSSALKQEAIVQYADGKGDLYGPMAEKWGPFNPEYFVMPDGQRMTSEAPLRSVAQNEDSILRRVSDTKELQKDKQFEISTRQGKNAKGTQIIDLAAMSAALPKAAALIRQYPGLTRLSKKPETAAQQMIDHIVENLLWLHDQMPTDMREQAKLWYDSARMITFDFEDKYNVSRPQAAGVLAALSPQQEWFRNISLAERTLDIIQNKGKEKVSDKLINPVRERVQAYADAAAKTKSELKRKENLQAMGSAERALKVLLDNKGKRIADVAPEDKPYIVRAYDEVFGDPSYNEINPRGEVTGVATKTNGDPAKISWGSYGEIGKAVNIILDGSKENISANTGNAHKVRNFYNNILLPNDPNQHVTIDTHAVAAGLLRPLAGNDTEVSHVFGPAPRVDATGSKGIYGLYADAYRKAAAERGLLAREMQSITWEAVRALFSPEFKTAQNKAKIAEIWRKERDRQKVFTAIEAAAGGIETPSWYRRRDTAADDQTGRAVDAQELSGVGRRDRRTGSGRGVQGESAGDLSGPLRSVSRTNIQTSNFKKWFKDSKVVDENGDPLVVQHATAEDFEAFARVRQLDRGGTEDIGFHFGSAGQARTIARQRMEIKKKEPTRDGVNTMPVYLSIQNPLRLIDAITHREPYGMIRALEDATVGDFVRADWRGRVGGERPRFTFADVKRLRREIGMNDLGFISAPKGSSSVSGDQVAAIRKIREFIESYGYDGLVYSNQREGTKGERLALTDSWTVFHPNQIKSVFNTGEFNPEDDRILRSVSQDEKKLLADYAAIRILEDRTLAEVIEDLRSVAPRATDDEIADAHLAAWDMIYPHDSKATMTERARIRLEHYRQIQRRKRELNQNVKKELDPRIKEDGKQGPRRGEFDPRQNQNVKKQVDPAFREANDQRVRKQIDPEWRKQNPKQGPRPSEGIITPEEPSADALRLAGIADEMGIPNHELHAAILIENGEVRDANEAARALRDLYGMTPGEAVNAASKGAKFRQQAQARIREEKAQEKAEEAKLKGELAAVNQKKNTAARELLTRIKGLEQPPPGYMARIARVYKAALVSAVQTSVNNFLTAQGTRKLMSITDLTELVLNKALAKAGREIPEDAIQPGVKVRDIFGIPTNGKSMAETVQKSFMEAIYAKGLANSVLDEFPTFYEELFASYASDIAVLPEKTGAANVGEKAMRAAEWTVDKANILNRLQEFFIRSQEFNRVMQIRLAGRGQNYQQMVEDGRVLEINPADIKMAVQSALTATFARTPDKNTLFGKMVDAYETKVPALLAPLLVTFPRFAYNATGFITDYTPVIGLVKAKQKQKGMTYWEGFKDTSTHTVAQQLVGTTLFLTALGLVRALGDDDDWFNLKVPGYYIDGKQAMIDIRGYQPFASFVYMANKVDRLISGKPMFSDPDKAAWEVAEAVIGISQRNIAENKLLQAAVATGKGLTGLGDEKEFERVGYLMQQQLGDIAGGFMRPLKTIKDLVAQYDSWTGGREAAYPDLIDRPMVQGVARSLPFANRILDAAPRKDFVTDKESRLTAPGLKVLGVTIESPDRAKETPSPALVKIRELDEVHTNRDILPKEQRERAVKGSIWAAIRKAGTDVEAQKAIFGALERAQQQGILTEGQAKYIERGVGLTELQSRIKSTEWKNIILTLQVASNDEIESVRQVIMDKWENARKQPTDEEVAELAKWNLKPPTGKMKGLPKLKGLDSLKSLP